MRLTLATPLYPPESGGPATYAKALEEGLPSRGVEVELVKFSDVRHRRKLVRHAAYFWNVYQAAKNGDVVLALDPVSVGLPALLAARFARKPFLVKVVGDYAWEQGRQRFHVSLPLDEFVKSQHVPLPVHFFRAIQTFVAIQARAVIVPSEYLKRIVSAWGVPPARITVIENAQPHTIPTELPATLAALPHPRVVTAGRLVPWKGMHGLIAAMVKVREHTPGAQLVIVGDGPERDNLERYASLRLKDGYVFTGALPHGETLAAIDAADVFVLNSTYEGLSHILLEALTLGKAIVATRAGGNPEVIENGVNGCLVSVGDETALAGAIVGLLANGEARHMLEGAARESAGRYAPERMLDVTSAFLISFV